MLAPQTALHAHGLPTTGAVQLHSLEGMGWAPAFLGFGVYINHQD